ncbi:hypothetical protein MRX96_034896 [Rhipicephalus microplus]
MPTETTAIPTAPPAQASFAQALSKKVGVAAAVPPFSAQLRPNATAAAIMPPTLTMNGVSHGVVVGATANGPRCAARTEEGSIHDSSPLPQVPGDVHPNGICGSRQRSSDELRLQVTYLPYPRKYKVVRVTKEPAKKLFFDMDDGSRCSVADYFQNRYGRLVYPNLPSIQGPTFGRGGQTGPDLSHMVIPMLSGWRRILLISSTIVSSPTLMSEKIIRWSCS